MTVDPRRASGLRPLQVDVARAFFAMPESAGFLLAGGAALVAQGLTSRPTRDLDLFTSPGRGDVVGALVAFEEVCRSASWATRRVRVAETFARLVVSSEDDSVDVAEDPAAVRAFALDWAARIRAGS